MTLWASASCWKVKANGDEPMSSSASSSSAPLKSRRVVIRNESFVESSSTSTGPYL